MYRVLELFKDGEMIQLASARLRTIGQRRILERSLTNSATSLELPLSDSLCTLDSSLPLLFDLSFDFSLSVGRFSLGADVFEDVFLMSVSMAVGAGLEKRRKRERENRWFV